MKATKQSQEILKKISENLNVDYQDLYDLINFESKWNPMAVNPITGAVGLLQFLDMAAIDLGYTKKSDILYDLKTQEEQLQFAVYPWLKRYAPYTNTIDLYMQVFYPAYRKKNINTKFPQNVINVNHGIKTPLEYYSKVKQNKNIFPLIAIGVIGIWLLSNKMMHRSMR